MKLSIKQTTYVNLDTDDVEFPLYRQLDLSDERSSRTLYTKIARIDYGNGFCGFSIDHRAHPDEIFQMEVEYEDLFWGSSVEEILGRGRYVCTPERFERVLDRAHAYLDAMRTGQPLPDLTYGWLE